MRLVQLGCKGVSSASGTHTQRASEGPEGTDYCRTSADLSGTRNSIAMPAVTVSYV